MLKIASLFSGIGTPEQSLKHLNIEHETIFACEIDKYARKTYLANNQEPNTFYEDVYTIDGNKYKDQIDILVGGSPCQSFSIAGKRKGVNDARGNLIYEYFRIVEEVQPKVFIYENVKGFLSIDKQNKKDKYGETFKSFLQSFKDLGYTTYHQVLNTKDYGIPQNRERIYIVGFKDDVDFHFQEKQELKLRLKDMLEDSVAEKYHLTQKAIAYMDRKRQGKPRWEFHKNEVSGSASCLTANMYKGVPYGVLTPHTEAELMHTHNLDIKDNDSINLSVPSSKTRRGRVGKEVAQTLDTACNQAVFNQEYIFRKLTPRECFRLQGFDDSFIFPEKMSDTQLYKQAGNGMSRNILDMIFTQILVCHTEHIEKAS